jgi:hypothetical protein
MRDAHDAGRDLFPCPRPSLCAASSSPAQLVNYTSSHVGVHGTSHFFIADYLSKHNKKNMDAVSEQLIPIIVGEFHHKTAF